MAKRLTYDAPFSPRDERHAQRGVPLAALVALIADLLRPLLDSAEPCLLVIRMSVRVCPGKLGLALGAVGASPPILAGVEAHVDSSALRTLPVRPIHVRCTGGGAEELAALEGPMATWTDSRPDMDFVAQWTNQSLLLPAAQSGRFGQDAGRFAEARGRACARTEALCRRVIAPEVVHIPALLAD